MKDFNIKNLLEKYNIKSILFKCLDEDLYSGKSFVDIRYLRSCKLYGDTILYGYSHVYDSNDKGFPKSEFAGHKLNQQLNKLEKEILEQEGYGIPHSFDINTIFALRN